VRLRRSSGRWGCDRLCLVVHLERVRIQAVPRSNPIGSVLFTGNSGQRMIGGVGVRRPNKDTVPGIDVGGS
jgi:hypothetical protein